MYEVRIHGRGGQGAVTAAELLSEAAFDAGLWAQAFPSFGSERTGAPVMAFCRFDDKPIRLREPVLNPDAVIVLDPTLLHVIDVFDGLRPRGRVLINSVRTAAELGADGADADVVTVPATEIARAHLGRPLPNGVMLGAFAGFTGRVTLEAVTDALRERFPGPVGDHNAAAASEAFVSVTTHRKETVDA